MFLSKQIEICIPVGSLNGPVMCRSVSPCDRRDGTEDARPLGEGAVSYSEHLQPPEQNNAGAQETLCQRYQAPNASPTNRCQGQERETFSRRPKASLGLQAQPVTTHGIGKGIPANPQHLPSAGIAPEPGAVPHATSQHLQMRFPQCSPDRPRKVTTQKSLLETMRPCGWFSEISVIQHIHK